MMSYLQNKTKNYINRRRTFKNPPKVKGFDFSDNEILDALRKNKILMCIIFTPQKCNLACPYCFTSNFTNGRNFLSLDQYKNIIKQVKRLGAKSIWWVGNGEPFLYKYWRELIDYITIQHMWIGIFTNGTKITKEIADFLNTSNVSLYVKMNSFNPEVQDELVGGIKGTYNEIRSSILNLLAVGFNTKNRLAIETVITRKNYNEIPLIFMWARLNNIIPFIEMMEYANIHARKLDVSMFEHKNLFYKLLDIDQKEFGYKWTPSPPWVAERCRNLYFSITIDAEGYIKPCSGLALKIGNIAEKPLEYWWYTPELRQFRDPSKLEPNENTLGNYGCKSHAYHLTGNPFAVDPRILNFRKNSNE
ncbi:MAG: radical SAM protein [Flavobacteriaceae bacterium]|nr:radical SAM protein [Flavobacteriaceae bacterium]